MIQMQVSRVHAPVTTLGPGRRLGIWFQGCSIGCAGCVSRDTWSSYGGITTSVDQLVLQALHLIEKHSLTGVTVSGGEPFEQPEALLALLRQLRNRSTGNHLDFLCYSGLPLKVIRQRFGSHLELIDALIPEPFVHKRSETANWRGSSNQPVILLSDTARERFAELPTGPAGMQIAVSEGQVWMVGVPNPNDMDRLVGLAASKGLRLGEVSWLA